MKNALFIFWLAMLSVCADDFYIWQRDWNDRVREAVRTERAAEQFYFLEGELTAARFPRGFAEKKTDARHDPRLPHSHKRPAFFF